MKQDLCATPFDRLNLDGGGGNRHDDGGFATQFLRRQCHALSVVAGRSTDDPAFQFGGRQMRHLVIGASQFE